MAPPGPAWRSGWGEPTDRSIAKVEADAVTEVKGMPVEQGKLGSRITGCESPKCKNATLWVGIGLGKPDLFSQARNSFPPLGHGIGVVT